MRTVATGFALVVLALLLSVPTAHAEQSRAAQLQSQADALASRIEQTTSDYQSAVAEVERLEGEIAQNELRLAQIQSELPAQRSRAATSIRSLYKFQQSSNSLLDLILSSESFNDFITTVHYLDVMHERNVHEIDSLVQMQDESLRTQALLHTDRDAAVQKQHDAETALQEARDARSELQARANQIAAEEAQAREEAIAAAREAQEKASATASEPSPEEQKTPQQDQAQAQKQQEPSQTQQQTEQPPASTPEQTQAPTPEQPQTPAPEPSQPEQGVATFTTSSGNTAVVQVPETPSVSTEPLVTNTTSQETGDWASRIDAYLEGTALEGYGQVFADAAATYGVDPRLSPAIATIESGTGEYCFLDHNAWGWGSESWDSWEEAINEQVSGLASGYDGTLTLEGAERYCPPNYQEWYSSVASEMDSI